jgi:Carboxysome Shell Carbonic Anhydrase.
VDQDLNHQLFAYERRIRNRFAPITDVLMAVSTMQHETAFVARAQQLSQSQLGYRLPEKLLEDAWVRGLDMPALHFILYFSKL